MFCFYRSSSFNLNHAKKFYCIKLHILKNDIIFMGPNTPNGDYPYNSSHFFLTAKYNSSHIIMFPT